MPALHPDMGPHAWGVTWNKNRKKNKKECLQIKRRSVMCAREIIIPLHFLKNARNPTRAETHCKLGNFVLSEGKLNPMHTRCPCVFKALIYIPQISYMHYFDRSGNYFFRNETILLPQKKFTANPREIEYVRTVDFA